MESSYKEHEGSAGLCWIYPNNCPDGQPAAISCSVDQRVILQNKALQDAAKRAVYRAVQNSLHQRSVQLWPPGQPSHSAHHQTLPATGPGLPPIPASSNILSDEPHLIFFLPPPIFLPVMQWTPNWHCPCPQREPESMPKRALDPESQSPRESPRESLRAHALRRAWECIYTVEPESAHTWKSLSTHAHESIYTHGRTSPCLC